MNKKIILFFIAFLWIVIAAAMIISKQFTLKTGEAVVLETVPVDPRDLLRGDYVVLRYKISTLYLDQVRSEKKSYRNGERIFVRLQPKGKFWEATAVQTRRSTDKGFCIRGRVSYCYQNRISIIYGIESYFVPEGEGKELEKSMRGNRSPVSVEAVVDSSGNALIKRVYIDNR